jgi:hypothetical protein
MRVHEGGPEARVGDRGGGGGRRGVIGEGETAQQQRQRGGVGEPEAERAAWRSRRGEAGAIEGGREGGGDARRGSGHRKHGCESCSSSSRGDRSGEEEREGKGRDEKGRRRTRRTRRRRRELKRRVGARMSSLTPVTRVQRMLAPTHGGGRVCMECNKSIPSRPVPSKIRFMPGGEKPLFKLCLTL